MSKKRKGPTPKRKQPRMRVAAQCEECGYIDDLCPKPIRGMDNYSPCPACGNATARYVEVAA